jgi:hypothetical protein
MDVVVYMLLFVMYVVVVCDGCCLRWMLLFILDDVVCDGRLLSTLIVCDVVVCDGCCCL